MTKKEWREVKYLGEKKRAKGQPRRRLITKEYGTRRRRIIW
jgi:hypothetical protein